MLWLGLYFRSFPLDVLARGDCSPVPRVIVFGPETRLQVLVPNAAALVRGIHAEMRLSAAQTLVDDLHILTRDAAAEQAALCGIAAWCGHYTSTVSLLPPDGLLLEIGASLQLFGGLASLRQTIEAGIAALGYHVQTGIAPTPLGAWWLARAGIAEAATDDEQWRAALARVPLHGLALEHDVLAVLQGVGVRTVGACLRLPRDALARRCGTAFIDMLDRALGAAADPRPLFVPPPSFNSRLPLPAAVNDCAMLLFAIHRLVLELAGFLQAREAGVAGFVLRLHHQRRAPTTLRIGLVSISRDAAHLLRLVRTQLERLSLPDVVHEVALIARDIRPLVVAATTLFETAETRGADQWMALVERLRARLGNEAVTGLQWIADHRPERAWHYGAPGECGPAMSHAPRDGKTARRNARATRDPSSRTERPGNTKTGLTDPLTRALSQWEREHPSPCTRPLWLLAEPLLLTERDRRLLLPGHHGVLTLRRGPERIESGWWDDGDVMRDYFVAQHDDGIGVWLFRDRRPDATGQRRWFLHGLFG